MAGLQYQLMSVADDLANSLEDEKSISKAEKSAKKYIDSKKEKLRAKSGSTHKSNYVPSTSPSLCAFNDDSSKFFCRPSSFQVRQASFFPATALLAAWKDTGETTAPTTCLQEDQISAVNDYFEFEQSSSASLFKVGSLRDNVEFWSNSIHTSEFVIDAVVKGYKASCAIEN